jgi:predicted Zn finger-like uncharacterized protein
MLIVCPSCASEYTIESEKLGAEGRTVRCAICRDTWFVARGDSPSPKVMPPAEAAPPEQPADEVRAEPQERAKPRPRRRLLLAAAAVLLVAAGGSAGWIGSPSLRDLVGHGVAGMREHLLARVAAWTSAPASGVAFRAVSAEIVAAEGTSTLLVTGEIVNATESDFAVPHLEILVRNGEEKVLATLKEAPPRPTLGPGEAVRFAVRHPSPPPDGRQVRVRFTTEGGIAVAVHSPST